MGRVKFNGCLDFTECLTEGAVRIKRTGLINERDDFGNAWYPRCGIDHIKTVGCHLQQDVAQPVCTLGLTGLDHI